jgi:hypothetical protein
LNFILFRETGLSARKGLLNLEGMIAFKSSEHQSIENQIKTNLGERIEGSGIVKTLSNTPPFQNLHT